MDTIIRTVNLILALGGCFIFGYIIALFNVQKRKKKKKKPLHLLEDRHCFECEAKLPVKVTKVIVCCTGCGLTHF